MDVKVGSWLLKDRSRRFDKPIVDALWGVFSVSPSFKNGQLLEISAAQSEGPWGKIWPVIRFKSTHEMFLEKKKKVQNASF